MSNKVFVLMFMYPKYAIEHICIDGKHVFNLLHTDICNKNVNVVI